jgi:hypothetical protein
MRCRRLAFFVTLVVLLLVTMPAGPASAQVVAFPGIDCTDAPTPDMPGQGLAAFFDKTPNPLPKQEDPFAEGAKTTIYEQYGYAGLRYRTYDLGCGPDAARDPDAVMGTALSNWMINIPISMCALTASITDVAFKPTFLSVFDPAITKISSALHQSLFATWVPAVIALLGLAILLKARRSALATTAAAIGWALMVVLLATAIFRWPLESGHFADQAVTSTLGSVVQSMDGEDRQVDPSVAVASNVQESIFYTSWLAGTLGSDNTATAKKYGPALFKAQALTWREAQIVEHDTTRGKAIIEAKQGEWKTVAAQIKANDPSAYEHLQGKRSETRIGYAVLSTVAGILALPFLLVSALLLLGSFLVVRLAVMMFPAFAVLGVFPAGRGLVIGIGRTVGAALVNAVIFGIGAAVTIRVLGLILDPASAIPGWLALALLPLFGFVMWVALKPFRRLTTMVSPHSVTDPIGGAAGALGGAARGAGSLVRQAVAAGVGVYTGNVTAAATIDARGDDEAPVADRVEAHTTGSEPESAPPRPQPALEGPRIPSQRPPSEGPVQPVRPSGDGDTGVPEQESYARFPSSESVPLPPIEPEWVDGEEVYAVYRPGSEDADSVA